MSEQSNLFTSTNNNSAKNNEAEDKTGSKFQPLAARMRPKTLDSYIGQEHILGKGKPLYQAIINDHLHSMVLWGPPGTGKTSLAKTIAEQTASRFISLSAVMSGVKDIRQVIENAKKEQQMGVKTVLFVDEVHRFNKSQQDAFLPFVEDGTITFIGATTENPAFELNNALLSRARVYVIKSLQPEQLKQLLNNAISSDEFLKSKNLQINDKVLDAIANVADGDARRALNLLEIAVDLAIPEKDKLVISEETLDYLLQQDFRSFDKGGDLFYDQISALHKSVRGSSPDGALYWMARMLDGGCDPLYLCRRVLRMASEDIGNADPRALQISLDAWHTVERLGSPEGELALAQAVIYLACAPKSNAVYKAFSAVMKDVRSEGNLAVPTHLRNARTKLAKSQGHGDDYRYAHSEPEGYAAGERYFPESKQSKQYYQPVDRGLELKIKEKLARLRALDEVYLKKPKST